MKSIAPVCGVSEVTRGLLGQHYMFDYNPLAKDRWMTFDFTSFSTIFQSYQDDVSIFIKSVCNGTPFILKKKSSPSGESNQGPLNQKASVPSIGLLGHLFSRGGGVVGWCDGAG